MELKKIVTLLSIVAMNAPIPLQVNAAESTTDNNKMEASSNQERLQKVEDSSDFSQIFSDSESTESSTQNSTQNNESNENVIEDSQKNDESIISDTRSNDSSNSSEDNTSTELNEKSNTPEKSINKNTQDVAQEAAPVTVKCVTDDGIVITTETLTGNIGDSYTATHVSHYYGWVLNERPVNYSGKFTSDPQTVTLVYSSAPVKRFDVKYIDLDSGKEISDSTPIYGVADAPYTTKAKNIDGYTLVKDSGNTSGTLPALYPYNGSSGSAGTIVYYYQGNGAAEPITVNYVDQDGHQLAESDTLTGQIGANYETSSKNIEGWALKEMPENSVGKFSDKKQTISYVYEKADSSPVTVKFVDMSGKSIYDDIVLSGKKGNTYTTSPIIEKAEQNIRPKWMLKTTPENATGKFSDTPQTVTYVYGKAVEIFPWIKNAKDNNATINFGPAQYVVEGEEYSVTLPEKPGWRFVGSDVPLTGIAEKDIDIELYYEMYTPMVNVKYTDKDGNELAKEENIEGKYGFPYETSGKNIKGWTLTETPENATGVLDQETQTVTYVYEKATAAPVTVKYVDKDGNELATPDTLNGNIGDPYTTEAKTIAGWTVTETPTNATGTFGEEAQTVTYMYEKATAAPVTVKYVDKDGNELATPDTLNGNIGDPYTTEAKTIAGWTVTETPTNATGTFGEEAQTVKYVYEKATAAPVTVKYVDKDGNELATPDTLNGNIGDPYTTEAKTIAGWTATETPTNATGTFGEEAQTVKYVYEKATILMSLKVKDSVIEQYSTWKPADNFVGATNMDGEDIPLENVLVTGAVDTSAPGFYQVKYTVNYTNSKEKEQAVSFISSITEETAYAAEEGDNSLSAVATIQVVKKENSLISNTTTTEKVDENIVQSYITKSNDGKYHLTNKTTKTLPKTGENKQSILIPTLGMSAIVSAIYGFIVTKKRKKLN